MIEELQELLNRDPFVPFRIVLTSGSTYDVTSPLQLVPEKAELNYFFVDAMAMLRLNQVAALETVPE